MTPPSIKKEYLILGLILLLAFLLRVYHLSQNVGFDFDQEYAAQFAHDVTRVFPIKLIGEGLSVQGLFMGPIYFYFLVPFFYLFNLHPIGGYVGSLFFGMVITAGYYFALSDVFSRRVGLLAAFLRSVLFVGLLGDWSMVPSYSSEFMVLLTWWCFYKYWHRDFRWLLLLALVFGLYTSIHPILFPFYFVFAGLVAIRRVLPPVKYIPAFIILCLIPVSPLILFEFLHKFMEIKTLLAIRTTTSAEIKDLSTLIDYAKLLKDYPRILFSAPDTTVFRNIIPFGIFGGLIVAFWRHWPHFRDGFHPVMLFLTPGVFLLYNFILPTHVPDYYFTGVEIIFFVYLCSFLGSLRQLSGKVLLTGLAMVFTAANLHLVYSWWQRDFRVSLYDKDTIVSAIARAHPDNLMNVYYHVDPGEQFGLGYLQRYYHIDSKGGQNAPTYTIIIPYDKQKDKVELSSGNVGLKIEK